jgi:N-acetyl-anhydromuramyl-L-alanine amidase AmpD
MELVRAILFRIEADPNPNGPQEALSIDGYPDEQVSYHVAILHDAGLIEATNTTTFAGYEWLAGALTWKGHEFLDAVRNDTVWGHTKQVIKQQGGSLPFELIQAIATAALTKMIGL